MCVCVCVCARALECVCVLVSECVHECMCVCERERERERVSEYACVYVCDFYTSTKRTIVCHFDEMALDGMALDVLSRCLHM